MAAIDTKAIQIPESVANGIWEKAQQESVLARLSGAEPQKFGKVNVMTLTGAPMAELVGEGAEKSPTPATYAPKTVTPYKLQVTVRVSNEVQWADEDAQIGIMDSIMSNCGISLGRALDLVGIHKLNPLAGTVASSVTDGIVDTKNAATLSGTAYAEAVEAAAGLIVSDGYVATGLAADPALSYGIATERDKNGARLFPEVGLGSALTSFEGIPTAVGTTVSASREAKDPTNLLGVVGQFDAFRWGIQRDIAAHVVEFGDPDGLGDLQRLNQIAIRAEIVYGIGIMDLGAFAKVVKAAD